MKNFKLVLMTAGLLVISSSVYSSEPAATGTGTSEATVTGTPEATGTEAVTDEAKNASFITKTTAQIKKSASDVSGYVSGKFAALKTFGNDTLTSANDYRIANPLKTAAIGTAVVVVAAGSVYAYQQYNNVAKDTEKDTEVENN